MDVDTPARGVLHSSGPAKETHNTINAPASPSLFPWQVIAGVAGAPDERATMIFQSCLPDRPDQPTVYVTAKIEPGPEHWTPENHGYIESLSVALEDGTVVDCTEAELKDLDREAWEHYADFSDPRNYQEN